MVKSNLLEKFTAVCTVVPVVQFIKFINKMCAKYNLYSVCNVGIATTCIYTILYTQAYNKLDVH